MTTATIRITLIDVQGRVIMLMSSTAVRQGKHQLILDDDKYKLKAGIYLLKLEVDGVPTYRRIAKTN
jgi:hypothetical protein